MGQSYRFKSDAEREEERSKRERARDERIATYGTNIPNVADVRAREQMDQEARLEEAAVASGRPAEEAKEYARALASGSRLEASKFEQQQRDKARQADYERTGFRTEGDRATYRTQEALRKLMNKPSAAVQFAANIDKSVALGSESALNTEAGLERAYEQGTRAGFSRQEIDQMIGRAEKNRITQRAYTAASQLASIPMSGQNEALQKRVDRAVEEQGRAAANTGSKPAVSRTTTTATGAKPAAAAGSEEPVTVEAVRAPNVLLEDTASAVERASSAGLGTRAATTSVAGLGARYAPNTPKSVGLLAKLDKASQLAGKVPVLGTLYRRAVPIALTVEGGKAVRFGMDDEYRGRKLSEFESFGSDDRTDPQRYETMSLEELIAAREAEPKKYVSLKGALAGAMDSAPQILSSATNLIDTVRANQRSAESEAAAETAARRNKQVQRLLREGRPDYVLTSKEEEKKVEEGELSPLQLRSLVAERVRALSPEDRRARAAYLTSLRRRVTAQ